MGARELAIGGEAEDGPVDVDDPRREDWVADNINKWEITESESLLFGRNFGVGTDLQTGPDGHLHVVSLSHGAVYQIQRRDERRGHGRG